MLQLREAYPLVDAVGIYVVNDGTVFEDGFFAGDILALTKALGDSIGIVRRDLGDENVAHLVVAA